MNDIRVFVKDDDPLCAPPPSGWKRGRLLKFYAKDARFIFPGKNSWAGEFHGKEAVGSWLRRFHRAGLKIEPHEIVVGGPLGTRQFAFASLTTLPIRAGR